MLLHRLFYYNARLIHHAHCLADLVKRLLRDLARLAIALVQHILDVVHILHERRPTFAMRCEEGR